MRRGVKWNLVVLFCVSCLFASTVGLGDSLGEGYGTEIEELIKGKVSDGKKRLAQSFMQTELHGRDAIAVTQAFQQKLGTLQGTHVSSFRSFNQSFILADRELYRLSETRSSGQLTFTTQKVARFHDFLGEVAFIESVEWDGMLFLLAAYKEKFLQLFTVSPNNIIRLEQSINCYGIPMDAQFFTLSDQLFLVVAANGSGPFTPVALYRWTGTHLDEEKKELVAEPLAVSTFPFQDSVIIVVAGGPTPSQKAGLTVLRFTGSRLVLEQFLPTSSPLAIQHFLFRSENYLLVTTSMGPTLICWWAGTELIVWDTVGVEGVRSVGIGYVRGETLILFAYQDKVEIFRPTANSLEQVDMLTFNTTILSASIYTEGSSVFIMAMYRPTMSSLVPRVIELRVVTLPPSSEGRLLERDPLLKCLSLLESDLYDRRKQLNEIRAERQQLLQRNSPGVFTGKLVVKKLLLNRANVGSFGLTPEGPSKTLTVSAQKLQRAVSKALQDVKELTENMKDVVFKSVPTTLTGKLTADELHVRNFAVDSIYVDKLNGQIFDPKNILMYSKDQRITGTVTADKIIVDTMNVGSLNGFKVQDLVRRTGVNQILVGLNQVPRLTAASIALGPLNMVNDISLNRIVSTKRPIVPITGTKTFSGLNLEQLAVGLINNSNFTQWIANLAQPVVQTSPDVTVDFGNFKSQKRLLFDSDVKIRNLQVENINDVNINALVSSLFLRGIRQKITGDITYTNKVGATKLIASTVNGISVPSLLTRTTNQNIRGKLSLESVSAPDIYTDNLNGLKISRDAAYVNALFPVTSSVTFRTLAMKEIALPSQASIDGQVIGKRFDSKPLIQHRGRVTVKGNVKLVDVNLDLGGKVRLGGSHFDFRDLALHYWTKSADQVITIPVVAKEGLTVESLNVGKINKNRPTDLVHLTDTKVLRGSWYIPTANIQGNVKHSPAVIQLPVSPAVLASSVVRTTGDYVISGRKTFVGGVTVNELKAVYLDNKKVADILGKDYSYFGAGGTSFEEIWVGGDLHVRSNMIIDTVNGVNLCDRMSKTVLIGSNTHIPAATLSAVTAINIDVKTFNGVPFTVLGGTAPPKMPRVRKIIIKGNLTVPSLENVMSINSKDVTLDNLKRIVLKDRKNVIRGKKTFAGSLVVEGAFNALHYNGVDLKELDRKMLSKTRNQQISVPITMAEIETSELKATTINGITVSNLINADQMSRQTIDGDLIFVNDLEVRNSLDVSTFENGCDLELVASRLKILDGRHWSSITVSGNLDWDTSLADRAAGLGYFLNSAVTKDDNQLIVAEVVFNTTVKANNIWTKKDINDISIRGIMDDALRKSHPDQVIRGQKIFAKRLSTSSMRVGGNVVAKVVGGVDIALFNASLVRVMGDMDVKGHKRFLQGFTSSLLKVDGTVNGLHPSLVATYDLPLLPGVIFEGPLNVKGDLSFSKVNDFSLNDFLRDRVTLDGNEHIQGPVVFERDLNVEGLMTPSINHVDIAEIVARESAEVQAVLGTKTFLQGLRVDGEMEVDLLYGNALRLARMFAILKDEDAHISGDVLFGNAVTMNADLAVNTTVNGVKMSDLAFRLRALTPRSLAQVRSIARTINDTNALLKARGDLSEFLYLEPVSEFAGAGSGSVAGVRQTRRAVVTDLGEGNVLVDAYGWERSSGPASLRGCGLPAECTCPTQHTLRVVDGDLRNSAWARSNSSHRAFSFLVDKTGMTVRVLTSTVSTGPKCRLSAEQHLNEYTTISWMTPKQSPTSPELIAEVSVDPSPLLGYVSDAKLMTVNGRMYVILALAYNVDLDTTNVNSAVVRLDTGAGRARIVHEFPTSGVSALDVFHTDKGAHVVVGNSYDSARRSPQVRLDIYRFNALTEKLEMVRSVPADGVVAVSSVVQGGDSLIVVAQEQLFAPVLVLKYDPAHDDYHFIQQLNANSVPTGLGVFYVGQPENSDAFLGVTTADNMFHLYKYYHIEGFKLVTKQEIRGVQGFTSFSVGLKQYLLFTSDEETSVVEVVKQSS